MINLKIILSSVRPTRKGPAIANWIFEKANKHSDFNTELIDLKLLNLPFMDEPEHPSLQHYVHQHTKDWSQKIDGADAFIFVTPEYNHGLIPPLKNAIDFLVKEWTYKPAAMVGYGGVSAGTRSLEQLRQIASALKMFPFDGIILADFTKQINENGDFAPTENNEKAAEMMFAELRKLHTALRPLRMY